MVARGGLAAIQFKRCGERGLRAATAGGGRPLYIACLELTQRRNPVRPGCTLDGLSQASPIWSLRQENLPRPSTWIDRPNRVAATKYNTFDCLRQIHIQNLCAI